LAAKLIHWGITVEGRPLTTASTMAAATRSTGMGRGQRRSYGRLRRAKNGVFTAAVGEAGQPRFGGRVGDLSGDTDQTHNRPDEHHTAAG
jgi:hypothetical protein